MQLNGNVAGLALVLLASTLGSGAYAQQQPGPPLPPLPYRILKPLHDNPQAWQQFRAEHANVPPAVNATAAPPATTPVWTPAWNYLLLSNPVQLTDGTVLAHLSCTGKWLRLTPDNTGSYLNGTWSDVAPMPAGYAPRFFASAVLPDGRMIVEGGEYNGTQCKDVETSLGAIYDPQTNKWTSVAPPKGWTAVGDASGIVLANGKFLLANSLTAQAAILNPTTLTWTEIGTGKTDLNNEENWTLLPNGDVLTVDAYTADANGNFIACGAGAEVLNPGTGVWSSAGSTIHRLNACSGTIKSFEAPTQILRPVGKVAVFGASSNATNVPVWTATYTAATGAWASVLKMPQVATEYYTMADAPAGILPNGTVLIAASPSIWAKANSFPAPTHFFTFNGTAFARAADVADSAELSSYEMNFLVLPTGQILGVETDFPNSELFSAVCCAAAAWEPVVKTLSNHTLAAGGKYTLTGVQLSGLTQGASYGDDVQADTNLPLVRITNTASQHVAYARTFGFIRSVAPKATSSTSFAVPAGIESGASTLVVVANGIPSKPVAVTVTVGAPE